MQYAIPIFMTLTWECLSCKKQEYVCGPYDYIFEAEYYPKIPDGWSIYTHLNMGDFIACSKQCYDNLKGMYGCLR